MVKLIDGTTELMMMPVTTFSSKPLCLNRLASRMPYSSEDMERLVLMRQ